MTLSRDFIVTAKLRKISRDANFRKILLNNVRLYRREPMWGIDCPYNDANVMK